MIIVGLIGLLILLLFGVGLGLQTFGFALLWFRRRHRVQEYMALQEHLAGHAVEALRRRDPVMPDSAGYAMLYEALGDVYRKSHRPALPPATEIKFIENRPRSTEHVALHVIADLRRGASVLPTTPAYEIVYQALCDLFRRDQRQTLPPAQEIARIEHRARSTEHVALHLVDALRRGDPVLPTTPGYEILYQALCDLYRKDQRQILPAAQEISLIENRGLRVADRAVVHVVWSGGESPVELDDLQWAVQLRLQTNPAVPVEERPLAYVVWNGGELPVDIDDLEWAVRLRFQANPAVPIEERPLVYVVWNGGESPVDIDDLDWAVQLRFHANRARPAAKFFLLGLGVSGVAVVGMLVLLVLALAAR